MSDVLDKAREKALEVIKEKNPDLENKEDVSEMVSIGATLFADLFTDPQKDVNFDFDRVLDFNGETGAYLQYTYARSNSIISKVSEENPSAAPKVDPEVLVNDKNVFELSKAISRFEETLIQVTKDHKPSTLAHYLIDLASLFNGFYISSRVLGESENVQNSRLAVVVGVRKVLKQGLELLGIPTPQKM
jgi:arginyl-tRNA synthetase